jgi:hypothetical protein
MALCVAFCTAVLQCAALCGGVSAERLCAAVHAAVHVQQCVAVRTVLVCAQCAQCAWKCAAVRLVVCELCDNASVWGSTRAAVCGSVHGSVRAVRAAVCVRALSSVRQ